MPCTGQTLIGPSITCLDFNLAWDISGATPTVTVTNNSTVVDASMLKWWFYITSPSGTAIYGVDLNTTTPPTPDVNSIPWTTRTFALPTPFGNPPCGQVEFSPNSPYTVTVFVEDAQAYSPPIAVSYSRTTIIVRPNGNTINTCGNFGKAAISMKVDCANKVIMVFDGTKTIYNSILTPSTTTNKWTVVYPADAAGDIPNIEAIDVPNANFPISVNSKGYMVYFNETCTYTVGTGITVKVQYKLYDKEGGLGLNFAINCNTNLCLLQCQMKKFYEQSKSRCGELENAQLISKMVRLQWLFSQILSGIFQPLCGIDIGALMDDMKALMGADDDCDCGCGDNDNFGFSNPTGSGSSGSTSGCCPAIVDVLDISNSLSPSSCPASFFPAAVYGPDASAIIGVAVDADSMISIINANASWQIYGTAFNMGNCQVGFYKNANIMSVPSVFIQIGATISVVDNATGIAPASCPASYFPATVYAPDGTTSIGTASSAASMIALINANAAWQAYGTAYYNGTNCSVSFVPASGVNPATIPPIVISATTGCVGGIQKYTAVVEDLCGLNTPPVSTTSFPLSAWVDFGSGPVSLGIITSNAGFIVALNAATGKPTSVTFSAGPIAGQLNYNIDNTNCAGYSGVIHIYVDANSGAYLLFAPNHRTIPTPQPISGGVYGVGVKTMAMIGHIAGLNMDEYWWHVIKVQGNYLFVAEGSQGRILCFDISAPLSPVLVGALVLPDTGAGNCFTGVPNQFGVDMYFSLYFPTDFQNMNTREIYVCEALSGSIWHVDFSGTPTVVKDYYDTRLLGKCPRVVYNGELYYSQDGNLESVTASSGILPGEIVRFNVTASVWDSSVITVDTIILNQTESIWAASWDGVGIIYFTGQDGTIVTYDPTTNSVVTRYAVVMGQTANLRLNSKIYLNKLYLSTYGGYTAPGGLTTGTRFIDMATLGTTNVITNFQSFLSDNDTHWNFMPLGNCNGVLTYENGSSPAGFALFKLDGTYIGIVSFAEGAAYNVVPVAGIGTYSPTTLVP